MLAIPVTAKKLSILFLYSNNFSLEGCQAIVDYFGSSTEAHVVELSTLFDKFDELTYADVVKFHNIDGVDPADKIAVCHALNQKTPYVVPLEKTVLFLEPNTKFRFLPTPSDE